MGMGKASLSFTVLKPEDVPMGTCPRWAVLGRSNVGKSTLLNALIHPQFLFKTGRTPGVTRGLIGVRVQIGNAKEAVVELVDLPGYGYAEKSSIGRGDWDELAQTLRERSHPTGLLWIWLADPARVPEDHEMQLLHWLKGEPYAFVFTKADGCKARERAKAEKAWSRVIGGATEGPFWASGLKGEGVNELGKVARGFVRLHTS